MEQVEEQMDLPSEPRGEPLSPSEMLSLADTLFASASNLEQQATLSRLRDGLSRLACQEAKAMNKKQVTVD
jgi:hypothetical protein